MIGLDKLMQHGIGLGGGSNIKSIQHGFVANIPVANTDYDVSIAEVDTSKAIVIVRPQGQGNYQERHHVTGVITSPTNLRLRSQATTIGVGYTIIEFEEVKSLQVGTIAAIGGGSSGMKTATIAAIDPTKSVLVFSKRLTSGSGSTLTGPMTFWGRIENANTLTFTFTPTSGISENVARIEYQVVEF